MGGKSFTNLLFSLIILLAVTASCQKDDSVKAPETLKSLNADSSNVSSLVAAPGNYLAITGTLTVKIKDSTYTFDASKDSIAFINAHGEGNNRYFGITAINKAHTLSFGISSSGYVYSQTVNDVAGSQLLINPDNKKEALEYSLSNFTGQKDSGSITVDIYNQGSELAKGSFFTFLATNNKATTPFNRVEGSFDLKLK
jgi:hypothetical protein